MARAVASWTSHVHAAVLYLPFCLFFFVSEICLGAQRHIWVPAEAQLIDANRATCALEAGLCVSVCAHAIQTAETCRTSHRIYASPVQRHNP